MNSVIIIPLLIVAVATFLIFPLNKLGERISLGVSKNENVRKNFTYQILLLILAVAVLGVTFLLNGDSTFKFFVLGNISAPAEAVSFFGIKEGELWSSIGFSLGFVITGVTALVTLLPLKGKGANWKKGLSFLPWIILLSLLNSFSEEIIYRIALVVPLMDNVESIQIMWISAIIFGVAHYRGMPGGVWGVLLAGMLGWVLTKSIIETEGFFWAWLIHFVQDVVLLLGYFIVTSSPDLIKDG